jgi:cytochrome c oxidase cbb3-type subunit 2
VYGYFLIFAEFAFLELVKQTAGEGSLRMEMSVLGASGVLGSLLAAWLYRPATYVRSLRWSALVCAGAAGLALADEPTLAAMAVGLATGWITVTLATGLRSAVALGRLGRAVGLGTGIAYAVCNLPPVFRASSKTQTVIAIVFMLAAAVATRWLDTRSAEVSMSDDYKPRRRVGWTVIFTALVWMDSAAFYIIQHTPVLSAGTWGDELSLWLNATVHLSVAAGAGVWMDRGRLGRVVLGAWVAMAVACVLLAFQRREGLAEVLYTAGVSLYSVALVYYPARAGKAWLTGVLFAAGGWLGSALGIGMAQHLNVVPVWFVVVAGVVVVGLLFMRERSRRGWRQPLLAIALVAVLMPGNREARADGDAEIVRGREVFIGEGCIHCHSQYVRPGTGDVVRWGPVTPLASALGDAPPLFGNRRQGPDLAQVGNRRSSEWNRLHLIDPRAISPGSRMPSYAYLFGPDDGRGGALVEYLDSLGKDSTAERAAAVQNWTPDANAVADTKAGARLFAQLCSQCHGNEGHGDGRVATRLSVRPPDWSRNAWRHADLAATNTGLARIIKFGLPGLPMAGHEYLRDDEVVSLASYVRSLHVNPTVP